MDVFPLLIIHKNIYDTFNAVQKRAKNVDIGSVITQIEVSTPAVLALLFKVTI